MHLLLDYYLVLVGSLLLYVLIVILARRRHKLKTIENMHFLLCIIFGLMWAAISVYYRLNLESGVKNRYVIRSLVDMSSGICLGVIICWGMTIICRKAKWFENTDSPMASK